MPEAEDAPEDPRAKRCGLRSIIIGLIVIACAGLTPISATGADFLEKNFKSPPNSARPRVWWHWLNGNITKDGIHKDLEWMHRIGIGGVQTFDVDYATPIIVAHRLAYMTPQWKDAFRYAASETKRLGLELTIASSPGWSETGGPWVAPPDGMKKVVWSTTDIPGGRHFDGRLTLPPSVSGPYLDISKTEGEGKKTSEFYADVAVLAFPAPPSTPVPLPIIVTDGEIVLDATSLIDGKYDHPIALPALKDGEPQSLELTFTVAQTVSSFNMFADGSADMYHGANLSVRLEAQSADGTWRRVADFLPSTTPTTVSFSPVTAKVFRVRLTSRNNRSPLDSVAAQGYEGANAGLAGLNKNIELSELRLIAEPRVNHAEEKAGFAVARDYYGLDEGTNRNERGVEPSAVVDLSRYLRPDGTLDWKVPTGDWRVLRIGYSLTGQTNHPAPKEATGLEVDKMDAGAVRRYMERYLDTYRATVGTGLIGKDGIQALLTDSTEVGAFNWTPGFLDAFRRLRGYDARPWLPTLTGQIIGSRADSDRFLYDFRKTIGDLHAQAHYGVVAEVAHAHGLNVYGEALEGWRVSLGDDIDMRRYADIPMAAMWSYPRDIGPRPLLIADMRTAASNAHLLGKPVVAAESMTSSRFPWAEGPADLRRVVDLEFAHGVNRIVVHTSPHQPVDDKVPGLSMRHIGQFFDRHDTWAEMAGPWIDYIARSSYLLQQGRYVADVAYYLGEEAPAGAQAMDGYFKDVPTQVGYDLVNASAITDFLTVKDGRLTTPGGGSYHLLYLAGTSRYMTVPVLRKIAELVKDGAIVVGNAPEATPSLSDDPKEFQTLVTQLWGGAPGGLIGRGRVIADRDLSAALDQIGLRPDFITTATVPATTKDRLTPPVDFVHRHLKDGEIYFVRNMSATPLQVDARFRILGKAPEIWRAETGRREHIGYRQADQQTIVSLNFAPEESYFVVFRKPTKIKTYLYHTKELVPLMSLNMNWSISFQSGRGAPAQAAMSVLSPLNENENVGIRYFSGVAKYTTQFALPSCKAPYGGRSLYLDLGQVGDLAEVRINGAVVGTAWHAPYRLDVGKFARPGQNTLEVRVANLWVNRLIGDAQPAAEKITWTTNQMYRADTPLRPSGLIGPVKLMSERNGGKNRTSNCGDLAMDSKVR